METAERQIEIRSQLYTSKVEILQDVLEIYDEGRTVVTDMDKSKICLWFEECMRAAEAEVDDGSATLQGILRAFNRVNMEHVEDRGTETEPQSEPITSSHDTSPTVSKDPSPTDHGVRPEYVRLDHFWKDVKLSGTIGDSPSDMRYLSFARQVEAARSKGRMETELIEGIIRAIRPSCRLRGYVEATENITLPNLQRVIRSFYQECSATELYQELCSLCQKPSEAPLDFLFRGLALRQKIVFASRERKECQYNDELVQQQFKRAVCTGLCDDTLRLELQQKMDTFTTDETLIEGFTEITRHLTEVQAKRMVGGVKVKPVDVEIGSSRVLSEAVNLLSLEMKGLTRLVKSNALTGHGKEERAGHIPQPSRNAATPGYKVTSNREEKRKQWRCRKCQSSEEVQRCTHCWKCGGDDHRKWECPENNTNRQPATEN